MIIRGKTLLTGDGNTVIKDAALRFDEKKGVITYAGPASMLPCCCPDEQEIDYDDVTILPGLIDMHVHIGYWWGKPDPENYDDFLTAYMGLERLQQARASGVTTVRDMASPRFLCGKMRLAAQKGYIDIPRVIHANQAICASGGHGWDLTGGTVECDGEEEIRKAVRRQLRDGADWIKVMTSHRSNISEYTQQELDAAVEESHRMGVKTAVHAGPSAAVEMAINAGFDTIEHGTFMTVAQAQRMAEKGIFWVPTIVAYTYIYETALKMREENVAEETMEQLGLTGKGFEYFKRAAEAYKRNFKQLYDTGVKVCAGTDMVMDGSPAAPVSRELWYMTQYGLSPVEAVRTATANCAEALGMAREIGVLAENALADILIVDGDASSDIRLLEKVRAVYQQGRVVFTKYR